ncbi:30S ribosomal protein S3Ae [Candidatus Bilamarchaeum dharawalense]|uniref:30S ribosomal protein S3Ae n=1 Tax=Candidatus Bilamarchaeum dharawalense TaxID=2885759 RepID=A0A5E4LXM5_9ARCH|nr:30S ribosomal protein S3Ae [Candidatus Bilamarchaeum dharawalense]
MAGKKVKVVDKWKAKKWYSVKAPAMFESREICEVVAAEENLLVNRVVKASLMELGMTGGGSQMAMFTALRFRIKDVTGNDANTTLLGHEILPSFIRTFARRGKSLIHQVVDEKTKDNEQLRLKIIAVTGARVSENTKRNLRTLIVDECKGAVAEKNFDEIIQDVIYGRLSSKIFNRLKQITKMKRVEVRKSERGEIFK